MAKIAIYGTCKKKFYKITYEECMFGDLSSYACSLFVFQSVGAGVPADLDPPKFGPPGPNSLADLDPPVQIR